MLTDESRTPPRAEDAIVAELDLKRILRHPHRPGEADRQRPVSRGGPGRRGEDAEDEAGTLDVAIHRIKKKILSPE
jgi:hypothetical protein